MTGFRFQDPWWMLLIPVLLLVGLLAIRRGKRVAILYSDVVILASLPVTMALRVKRTLPWMRLLGLALVIVALGRPQMGEEDRRIRTEGIAIEMCIDRSGSMRAMDFHLDGQRVNRLAAVKRVFRDFLVGTSGLSGREDDLIGLIAFGGYANSKCPLTLDHGVVLQVLDTVKIPEYIRDARGRVINERLVQEDTQTAIGDAVTLAVDRLKDAKAKSKVIILLSDGENTAGVVDPAEAAEAAKAYGIKIYTIGVGSTGTAPFPAVDVFGNQCLVSRQVRLDEATLKMLAESTGGRYFNATDTQTLEEVYAEIDKLQKTATEERLYTEYRELYQSLLCSGLGLILLEIMLTCTRFRSLP